MSSQTWAPNWYLGNALTNTDIPLDTAVYDQRQDEIPAKSTFTRRRTNPRSMFLLCLLIIVIVVLVLGGIGIALGLTLQRDSPVEIKDPPPSQLKLSVDLVDTVAGQDITISEGSHVIQCTATNVHLDSSITWAFGDNVLQTTRVATSSEDRGDDLIDLTSTINIIGISQGANNAITCYTSGLQERRKRRQASVASSVSVRIIVQGEPVAQDLTFKIDSAIYATGTEVHLDEGPHNFECTASNAELNTAVTWDFNGESVAADSIRTLFKGDLHDIDSTVTNHHITGDDCGISVRCSVISSCSPNVVSGSPDVAVVLKVATKPTSAVLSPSSLSLPFDSVTRVVTVVEDEEVEFECEVSGSDGEPDVTFTLAESFGTSFISTNTATSNTLDCVRAPFTKRITVTPTHDQHHGQNLQCSASTTAGTTPIPGIIYLNVEVPPRQLTLKINSVSTEDSSVTLDEGQHMFECITDYTRPVSTVTWYTDSVVSEDAYRTTTSGDLVSYTSVIGPKYLSAAAYCGVVIQCSATNCALDEQGEQPISASTTLLINTPPQTAGITVSSGVGSSYDPDTSCTPTMTLIHGLSYILDCEVTGADAEADVTWTLTQSGTGSTSITEIDTASTSDVDCLSTADAESFALTVEYTQHHEETLSCVASNSAGSVNHTIAFDVLVAPTMSDITLVVDSVERSHQDTITILEGDSLEFDCQVTGAIPSADVSWDFSGTEFSGSTTTRTITADTTATCSADNSASPYTGGAVSKEVTIDVAEPQDCYEILQTYGRTTSGLYWIYPIVSGSGSATRMQVWCDMDTDGGGWTVFQRRVDGSVDFYLGWDSYKNGFGDLSHDFWLGLDNIYAITNNGKTYQLRMDLYDGFEYENGVYSSFSIGDEGTDYTLALSAYFSGGAGDALTNGNGQGFSTLDMDHDGGGGNCAVSKTGAWWYNNCHYANLNGRYLKGAYTPQDASGIDYQQWTGYHYSLSGTEMKLRPV